MIITLCGSARFERHYIGWNLALTMAGHTVFSLSAFPSQLGSREWYNKTQKELLDGAHFRKIEASDSALFLNVGAYMGPSTLREWEFCKRIGKERFALESWGAGLGLCQSHSEEHLAKHRAYFTENGMTSFPASPVDTYAPHSSNLWESRILGSGGSSIRHGALDILDKFDCK